jgi:hypothetical protein
MPASPPRSWTTVWMKSWITAKRCRRLPCPDDLRVGQPPDSRDTVRGGSHHPGAVGAHREGTRMIALPRQYAEFLA